MTLRAAVAVARYQSRVQGWHWFLPLLLAVVGFCHLPWIPIFDRYSFACAVLVLGAIVPSLISLGSGTCLRLLPVRAAAISSIRWLMSLAMTLACTLPLLSLGRVPIGTDAITPATEACIACMAPMIALWMNLSLPWLMRSPLAVIANTTLVFIVGGYAGYMDPVLLARELALELPTMIAMALAAVVAGLAWSALVEPRLGLVPWNAPSEHSSGVMSLLRGALPPLATASTAGGTAAPRLWLGPSARLCLRTMLLNPTTLSIYPITVMMCVLTLGPVAGMGLLMAMPCLLIASQMTSSVQRLMLGGRVAPRTALAAHLIAGPLVVAALLLATLARPFPLQADALLTTRLSLEAGSYIRQAFPQQDLRLADGSLVTREQFAADCRTRHLAISGPFLQQQLERITERDSHVALDADDMAWTPRRIAGGGDMRFSASSDLRGEAAIRLTTHGRVRVLARRRAECALLVLAATLVGLLLPTLAMEGRRPHSRSTKGVCIIGMVMLPFMGFIVLPYVSHTVATTAVAGSLPVVTVPWWSQALIAVDDHAWLSVALLLLGIACVLALAFSRVRYLPRVSEC